MTKKPPPPPNAVTSRDAEELLRMRSRLHVAERLLRKTGDPWAALRALGIVAAKGGKDAAGRRGHSGRERARLADLYLNMMTAPGPCRPVYARTPERLDLLMVHAAEVTAAQREGRPIPPLGVAAVFEPDVDVPMPAEDALRNVQRYLGLARATTWKLLRAEDQRRRQAGLGGLDLPRRAPK